MLSIVETPPIWHCTGTLNDVLARLIRNWHCSATMSETQWRLLTTLPDLPSAQSLAEIMIGDGIAARVMSDASVLGQAAPSRIYVDATHLHRARSFIAQQGQFTDEELAALAVGESGSADTPE
jgi:hypothetical protein